MTKIKILYIGNNTSRKTNYGSSILLLSRLLKEEGYDVKVSSCYQNIFLRLIDMSFTVLFSGKKTDYLLIDTFSSLNFFSSLITSQIARIMKIKYIPILRGGDLPNRLQKSEKLSKMIFKYSYLNVAPSNYLKTEFQKSGYKTMLIPNILTIDDYDFKLRLNIKPNLLWVRAFQNIYNPLLAIETINLLRNKYPEAKLCMIGPLKDDSIIKVKQRIKELDLNKFIKILGVIPKKEWHQKSVEFDIIINTTNFDNTPNSIIEAMALGLTVVSTNVGGMPYLIENNKEGVLVEKQSPEQMASAIISIIETNNTDLAIKARKKAESFAWQEVKKEWNKILV